MATVTIIGSGMMGSALAFPARENGHLVRLVGTHLDRDIISCCKSTNRHPKFVRDFPEGVEFYQIEELEAALSGCELVIGGVSSFGVDWFAESVLPLVPNNTPLLTVTKGLLDTPDGKLLTYPEIWRKRLDELGKSHPLCAIGGPCTSYELVAHDQTMVSFCGEDITVLEWVRGVMQTDYYHISITRDVVGIESAVALKNGYALGIALTIGLNQRYMNSDELHFNSQAAVFSQACKEMSRLLEFQNALSVNNLSVGLGDLYVTVYGGRTRLVGILLGKGYDIDEARAELAGVTLESLVVAERVARAVMINVQKGALDPDDFPLLLHIHQIICNKQQVNIPWDSFTYTEK